MRTYGFIASPNTRRHVQVAVQRLKKGMKATPLPILHFTVEIWNSNVSGDKYLGTYLI